MARIFSRQYARSRWNPQALEGPVPGLTLREWEVSILLCSQPPQIKQALRAWLIAPTAARWPRPDHFSPHLSPFTESDLSQPTHPLPKRLWDEMKAIRQTLDLPFDHFGGITRDLLLVTHGQRLRQIIAALGEAPALYEIAAMLRLTERARARPPAYLSTRWGGRWAAYFSGASE